jgi:hypothetical protein
MGCLTQDSLLTGFCFVLLCFDTESHRIAQTGLELEILLPHPPQCQDYSCVPPYHILPATLKKPASLLVILCRQRAMGTMGTSQT